MPNQDELYHISQQENFARLDREDIERSRVPCDWCGSWDGMDCYVSDIGFNDIPPGSGEQFYGLPNTDYMYQCCTRCNKRGLIPSGYVLMTGDEVQTWLSTHPSEKE